jgi:thiamine transport system ATP-binding protein
MGGLAVRGAVVRYGATTAVAGVDLEVADGEIVALLGPSGCGKSSLLRAVAGLEPLASGTVAFDGDDLAGVPVHRRGFGLLFQDGQLFAHRDVARNVAYGLETARVPRGERQARVRELLDDVGLRGYGGRAVSTLSGGERQRVALARALAPRPRLLLLDEPFSALDRGLRERLAVEVRDVLRATGTTAILVTHDHDEAFTMADRVGVMQAGRILQVAPAEELWRAPASREVASFLGYQAFIPRDEGGWLAVGPSGLRVTADDADGAMPAAVVGTAFRRGRTEVTVDLDLGEGSRRLVALLDAGAAVPAVGTKAPVAVDNAGCAVVPEED